MGDVVFVVCGGGATAIFENAEDRYSLPAVVINSNERSEVELEGGPVEAHWDQYIAYGVAASNSDKLEDVLSGYRVAVIFGMLGGGTATGMLPALIECARSCGCKVVSIAGIPMVFEEFRRPRALAALPEIVARSDRTLILDMEASNRLADVVLRNALVVFSRTVAFAVDNLVRLLEGPFFSTFSQKAYTFSYVSGMDPADAVSRAMDSTLFETDPLEGKLIILIGSGYGLAQKEQIRDEVVSRSGILPEIINRDDAEDSKVLVYASVVLRSLLLPGFAVLDDLRRIAEDAHDGVVLVLGRDRTAHHAPEHDGGRLPPVFRILYRIQQIAEEVEHEGFLMGVCRLGAPGDVLGHEELVHHGVGGVGQVHHRVLVACGYVDEYIAHVDLRLVQSGVLPAEHHCDLLGVSAGGHGEVPHGDRHPGEVAVALGRYAAGAGHEEAAVDGLLEGIHDMDVIQDG